MQREKQEFCLFLLIYAGQGENFLFFNILESFMIFLKFLTMPKCWCNQNKTVIPSDIYSIMSLSYLHHHLLSFSSGATIKWITLSRWKKYKKKYRFLRRTKFVKNVCNWVCFQYMNHNPLKQGSHYVNRVLRWIFAPESTAQVHKCFSTEPLIIAMKEASGRTWTAARL